METVITVVREEIVIKIEMFEDVAEVETEAIVGKNAETAVDLVHAPMIEKEETMTTVLTVIEETNDVIVVEMMTETVMVETETVEMIEEEMIVTIAIVVIEVVEEEIEDVSVVEEVEEMTDAMTIKPTEMAKCIVVVKITTKGLTMVLPEAEDATIK